MPEICLGDVLLQTTSRSDHWLWYVEADLLKVNFCVTINKTFFQVCSELNSLWLFPMILGHFFASFVSLFLVMLHETVYQQANASSWCSHIWCVMVKVVKASELCNKDTTEMSHILWALLCLISLLVFISACYMLGGLLIQYNLVIMDCWKISCQSLMISSRSTYSKHPQEIPEHFPPDFREMSLCGPTWRSSLPYNLVQILIIESFGDGALPLWFKSHWDTIPYL